MVRVENSIEIKASPEKVWEMLALDRLPEWMDVMEMQSGKYTSEVLAPEDKYRVGAIAHMIEKRWEYDLEITESLENEKLVAHTIGKYNIQFAFTLKPVDGETKLTCVGDIEMPWGVFGKALGGLMRRSGEKDMEKASEKLKSILEK